MTNNKLLVYNTLVWIGNIVLFVNTLLYIKSFGKKKSKAFNIFSIYLIFILLIQLITACMRWYKLNNLYFSHFYFIGQFCFLSFFYLFLEKKRIIQRIIKATIVLILVSLSINYINNPEIYFEYNIFEVVITAIPLIIYSFHFFFKRLDSQEKKFIYLNSGFFIYISCSTLLFATGNITASLKKFVWYSNVILYIMYQVLVFIEWYKNFRRPSKIVLSQKNR
jgi:hypothetical protein